MHGNVVEGRVPVPKLVDLLRTTTRPIAISRYLMIRGSLEAMSLAPCKSYTIARGDGVLDAATKNYQHAALCQ